MHASRPASHRLIPATWFTVRLATQFLGIWVKCNGNSSQGGTDFGRHGYRVSTEQKPLGLKEACLIRHSEDVMWTNKVQKKFVNMLLHF